MSKRVILPYAGTGENESQSKRQQGEVTTDVCVCKDMHLVGYAVELKVGAT
jgi:hypothetical protein